MIFDPPDAGLNPCPYPVEVTVTSDVIGLPISQVINIYVTLPGDFNHDGDVDGSDLAVFAADFGRTDCATAPPCEGDFDGDGDLYGSDLAVFAADFGHTDYSVTVGADSISAQNDTGAEIGTEIDSAPTYKLNMVRMANH